MHRHKQQHTNLACMRSVNEGARREGKSTGTARGAGGAVQRQMSLGRRGARGSVGARGAQVRMRGWFDDPDTDAAFWREKRTRHLGWLRCAFWRGFCLFRIVGLFVMFFFLSFDRLLFYYLFMSDSSLGLFFVIFFNKNLYFCMKREQFIQ